MKILILGGAGAMARVILRDLLDNKEVDRVGLADVNLEKVREVATGVADDRTEIISADARDESSLVTAMKGWDAVINSTWYELNLKVMSSAIRSGVHYLDLGGLYHMTLKQLETNGSAVDAGVTCVTGLGSSPGITNLMAAHGANGMTGVEEVRIRVAGSSGKNRSSGFAPPYSIRTIIDEACLPAATLRGGRIEMVPGLSIKEEFVLPDPVGRVAGYYTLHSELATLPSSIGKGVSEMNFIVAFSPEFSRSLELLVRLGFASKEELLLHGGKIAPYDVLIKLVDSLPKTAEADGVGVRRIEMSGDTDGRPTHLIYDCTSGPHRRWGIGGRALGTGVPASLGAQWLCNGKITEKGVLPPERCIDPGPFLHELGENGRGLVTTVSDGSQTRLL